MKELKIGIIGGKGKMGSWFKNYFTSQGFNVIVSDIGTKLKNNELVEKADAVIFSVPISKTVEVIESVLPFTRKEQILLDFTSIKTPAITTMLKSECEVLGLHPMFSPFLDSMADQTIVICKARARDKTKTFEQLFFDAGAKIKIATSVEHDKAMAVVQSMTHFSSIVASHCLMKLGIDVNETLEYTSPVYKISMEMIGRIMAQNPQLYAEIEIYNPYATEVLEEFVKSSQELLKKVKKKDADSFVNYFKESASHMGEFKEIALKETNKINRW